MSNTTKQGTFVFSSIQCTFINPSAYINLPVGLMTHETTYTNKGNTSFLLNSLLRGNWFDDRWSIQGVLFHFEWKLEDGGKKQAARPAIMKWRQIELMEHWQGSQNESEQQKVKTKPHAVLKQTLTVAGKGWGSTAAQNKARPRVLSQSMLTFNQ